MLESSKFDCPILTEDTLETDFEEILRELS